MFTARSAPSGRAIFPVKSETKAMRAQHVRGSALEPANYATGFQTRCQINENTGSEI